jgi:PPP family 3-phenylpropionic acid transporter
LSEIPILFFSGKMLRRWAPRGLLTISLVAYVLRAMLYTAAAAPWQVLLIQLLHGFTFSTMWVAGVSLSHQLAPEGLGATGQGLFSSTSMGLGGIVGALVGGVLLDQFGGKGMFFYAGMAVLAGLLIFLIANRVLSPSRLTEGQ